MPDYHPDAELAPRDVVSRSIALHLAATGAAADSPVYLDARGVEAARGQGFLARRFPTISAATRAAGYDWAAEPLPVSPAAHYWMGGVATDLWGRTSVPGLYAAGEVACTGVQGANRLASNSLLEGLVFGRRAVQDFLSGPQGLPATAALRRGRGDLPATEPAPAPVPFSRDALRRLMTGSAGVTRTDAGLDAATALLAAWAASAHARGTPPAESGNTDPDATLDQAAHEDRNLLVAAQLLVAAARKRTGSVGAHFRSDSQAGSARPAAQVVPARATPKAGKAAHRLAASSRPKQRIPS
jgi:L-aspartate oxidase